MGEYTGGSVIQIESPIRILDWVGLVSLAVYGIEMRKRKGCWGARAS